MADQNLINNTDPTTESPETQSRGALAGTIIVIIVLIIGGIYFLFNRTSPQKQSSEDKTTSELLTQGTSSDLQSIEADLSATNLDKLGQELLDIETEVGAPGQ
jgi:uncharacterized protein HemX